MAATARTGASAAAVPFCAMAVVAAANLVSGPAVGLLPLLSLGPALAPVTLGPARTALTGVLAVVLSLALAAFDRLWFSTHTIVALATVVGVTGAALVASAARQHKEKELINVRAVADVAQRVLLHQVPRQIGADRISVRYISAAAAARIGGDLYDVVVVQGATRLIVADVQGKGLSAVQTAAVVLAAFRECAYDAPDLVTIAEHIERSLRHQQSGDKFVTAIMAETAVGGTEMTLLNCGHPPPLLVSRARAGLVEPVKAALPLGLGPLVTDERTHLLADGREEHSVAFGPDDSMLFYTDGISEARDRSGAFYPLLLSGTRVLGAGADPDAALAQLYDDVLRHVGGHLHDDSAALLIKRQRTQPQGAEPGARPDALDSSIAR